MNKNPTVGQRIAGSVVGLLVGGLALGGLGALVAILFLQDPDHPDESLAVLLILAVMGLILGATIGAPVGATVAQRRSKRRSSFWLALLGAVAGLLTGGFLVWFISSVSSYVPFPLNRRWSDVPWVIVPVAMCTATIAGAVIGSGWKAKPAEDQGQKRDQDGSTEFN